jgi:hypothetical protein
VPFPNSSKGSFKQKIDESLGLATSLPRCVDLLFPNEWLRLRTARNWLD